MPFMWLCKANILGVCKASVMLNLLEFQSVFFFFFHGETCALVKDINAWQKHILKVPMSEEREFSPSDGEENVPTYFKHGLK